MGIVDFFSDVLRCTWSKKLLEGSKLYLFKILTLHRKASKTRITIYNCAPIYLKLPEKILPGRSVHN